MTGQAPSIALVTAARNEEANLGRTLASVVAQTVRPRRWVVVSDGSTDATDALVAAAAEEHPWIHLERVEGGQERDFASKVHALQHGLQVLGPLEEDFVGVLDADVVLEPHHFETLVSTFAAEPTLGLAGGQVWEEYDGQRVLHDNAVDSVAGAVQLFRREAFEATGGFRPLRSGGEDTVVELEVRAAGWTTRTLRDLPVTHQGRVISGRGGVLHLRFRRGWNNWLLGYHPLFALVAVGYRMGDRPWGLAGLAQLAGYLVASVRRPARPVSRETVAFLRREQLGKLGRLVLRGDRGR